MSKFMIALTTMAIFAAATVTTVNAQSSYGQKSDGKHKTGYGMSAEHTDLTSTTKSPATGYGSMAGKKKTSSSPYSHKASGGGEDRKGSHYHLGDYKNKDKDSKKTTSHFVY